MNEPGEITTRGLGGPAASKVQYRCSRGHVFEDVSPESEAPSLRIIEIDKPEQIRGRYCGICFREMVGLVAPLGQPLEESGGPIATMYKKIADLEELSRSLEAQITSLSDRLKSTYGGAAVLGESP